MTDSLGAQDLAGHLKRIAADAAVVAALVGDPAIPVRAAMAVLPDQCSLATAVRLRAGKILEHPEVLVCTPRTLLQQMKQTTPLGLDQIVRIGHRLDAALPRG